MGAQALASDNTGATNTAVGLNALSSDTGGGGNTAIGSQSGSQTTGSANLDIDNNGVAGESSTIRIGRSNNQNRTFIAGIRGITTGQGDAVQVLVDSAGQLGTASSSRRVKRDIRPLGRMRALMKLRPVSFRYRSGPPELHYGLIAEQVAKVLPTLAVYGKDGLPGTVQYQELPALLLAKVQAQQRQLNRQQTQIDELTHRIAGR